MKALQLPLALVLPLLLAGCELIGDIFKAGVWTGVIIVLLVIAGIGFLVAKLFK